MSASNSTEPVQCDAIRARVKGPHVYRMVIAVAGRDSSSVEVNSDRIHGIAEPLSATRTRRPRIAPRNVVDVHPVVVRAPPLRHHQIQAASREPHSHGTI